MSDIRNYFAKKSITSTEKTPAGIPDPCGPLSRDVPSSSIRKANEEVESVLERQQQPKRGPYRTQALSKDQKLKVAKYASIHGTAAAIRTFSKEMPEVDLKESTVRCFCTAVVAVRFIMAEVQHTMSLFLTSQKSLANTETSLH